MKKPEKKLCSCGHPQSYPIPHEHDRTERENQIIKYYEENYIRKKELLSEEEINGILIKYDVHYRPDIAKAIAKRIGKEVER